MCITYVRCRAYIRVISIVSHSMIISTLISPAEELAKSLQNVASPSLTIIDHPCVRTYDFVYACISSKLRNAQDS